MSGAGLPWDFDPFNPPPTVEPIKVLWDYESQAVVGDGMSTLFDTHWTYMYHHGNPLPWHLSRCPGDLMYVAESAVPEMVRLAVMVAS